jgi:hypothetical protein
MAHSVVLTSVETGEPLKTFVKNFQQIRLIKAENGFSKPENNIIV